ncbi:LacI family transcriptional regulator [Virgisporangium aliadipatigenens]|uniref:LacI family transcriptional regulator n=1 Tax=Virgisporangium aliadipatigenens TaxID=741659 RepID=A0A8J3YJF5_9ACTN|nr:LacI family DNA-binding transcriptional regulator [Virgisporangium aliadipatigenens]GIJ45075.1 LacI family transcriptional regulator [Virgisporangium aliadipatigenens]
MTDRRATMAEVAAAAGVSVPTVSKVVNGRPDVSPSTRQRVEEVLRTRNYSPPRARARNRVGLIDLVFVDLGSPWAMEVLAGVEEVAHRAETGVVVSAVHGRRRTRPDRRWLEQLATRRSDGVLLVLSELSAAQQAQLDELGIPVVIVDPAGAPGPDVPSVGATNWAGGVSATEHLISLGHKRIAVIGGPTDVLCSRARVDGYRAAMNAAGLKVPSSYVRTGDFLSPTGYRETLTLLDQARPPTAVFVCADQMALGAYEALYERGMRVPDDMSIVGFDDLEEARWGIPPLTTVRQPLVEMAAMGTRMLLSLVSGEELDTPRVELSTSLVLRSSTASPAPGR